ncbi:peroxiredoxin [Acidilutibacter cellobiosedens]|jgi:peroxiredoxin Q/BCP|uniref:thioredoxin-dependent peroxiredoxin n=1 Tax=Acidilutibacter cellobiosedens TaxID=2507161 RepID=A0A410QEC6_9FIRM|nr:peroxiredoxin [Acidilutibacter cellobiosedens]MBE6083437.1 peroxiredoxin [Tissierellaceae bacterium]QAT62340.1 peroxiredoxin [Acidilutibacter cellobiosedens]
MDENIKTVVGEKALDFTFKSKNNDDMKLSDFIGKKNVILYFYPKDNTPGCTLEAMDFTDLYPEFEAADTEILGISRDSAKSHESFCNDLGIPFPLISDESGEIHNLYGVLKPKSGKEENGFSTERSTFIIDKKGILVKEYRKVKVAEHANNVLKFVKNNLQS